VGFTLAISIIFPVVFEYETTYAAPTAAYAVQSERTGCLFTNTVSEPGGYWKGSLAIEADYPAPSILLSVFVLLTGVPRQYTMFNPISALANLAYFVLARRILRERTDSDYSLLFSALYYMFLTCDTIFYGGNYVGRASFGDTLFAFFLLGYMYYVAGHGNPRDSASWLPVLILFTLATGETYYTMTLAIALLTSLMALSLGTITLIVKRPRLYPGLAITLLAIVLFLYKTFAASLLGEIAPSALLANMTLRVLILLGIEASPALFRNVELLQVDPLITVTGSWIVWTTKLLSILALAYVLFKFRPEMRSSRSIFFWTIWLFSLGIFLSNLSEFAYLFIAPISPIRILVKYGLIATLFIVNGWVGEYKDRERKTTTSGKPSHKKVIVVLLLIVIITGSLGSLGYAWYYGVGKPYAYQRVETLSYYLLSHSSPKNPIILTGDAYYTANIFFISALLDELDKVIPEPLREDAVTLYNALHSKEMGYFRASMEDRDIKCLLIVQGVRTVWGDAWGPAVTLPDTGPLEGSFSLVYQDGYSRLFCAVGSGQ